MLRIRIANKIQIILTLGYVGFYNFVVNLVQFLVTSVEIFLLFLIQRN